MKNLYERLKPEHKETLLHYYKDLPFVFEDVKNDLKENEFVIRLRYGTVYNLQNACTYLANPLDYFNEQ